MTRQQDSAAKVTKHKLATLFNSGLILSLYCDMCISWFGDNFIDSEVSFTQPDRSSWRLKQKISENAYHETDEDAKNLDMVSETRAVFICSRVDSLQQQEAVINIRMQ